MLQQKSGDSSGSSRRKQSGIILYTLFVEILLIVAFFYNHGWGFQPLAQSSLQNSGHFIADLDPPLRQPAPPLPVLDSQGHAANLADASSHPQILIFFSGCQTCSLRYMIEAQQFQHGHPQIAFRSLVIASPAESAEFSRMNNLQLDFYTENDLTTQKQYNVQWHPRVFALDSKGQLAYAQAYNTPFGFALMQAAAAAKP